MLLRSLDVLLSLIGSEFLSDKTKRAYIDYAVFTSTRCLQTDKRHAKLCGLGHVCTVQTLAWRLANPSCLVTGFNVHLDQVSTPGAQKSLLGVQFRPGLTGLSKLYLSGELRPTNFRGSG